MAVEQLPDPQRTYWNNRFLRYRHTGWNIPGIYEYDQRIRVRAVMSALRALHAVPGPGTRALDIGCGTGDITAALASTGATVAGYDISGGVIEQARQRFRDRPDVVLECANLVHAELEHGPFDLVTSVTVLQHQVDDAALDAVIGKLARALRPGGTILVLETVLPEGASGRGADHYIRPRTRSEWLERFAAAGLRPVYERSYPQTALTTLGWVRGALRRGRPKPGAVAAPAVSGAADGGEPPAAPASPPSSLKVAAVKAFLAAFTPLDQWLRVPTPRSVASGRIMAFRAER